MEIEDYREYAKQQHSEYRSLSLDGAQKIAQWTLAASAAGALACFNGLIGLLENPEAGTVLASGLTGYIFAMAATGAGMSVQNASNFTYSTFWQGQAEPIENRPSKEDGEKEIKKASRQHSIAVVLLGLGNISFMLVTSWGGWALSKLHSAPSN